MEISQTVKVVVYPERYKPNMLCFNLIFEDGSFKYHELDRYEVTASRCSERDLFVNLAQDYFELLDGVRPEIILIFY